MFKNSAKFNLTDFSVMLFTIVIALCYVFQHGTARDVVFERILGCVFVYLSVRLICSIFPKTINYATLLFISGYSLFEAYKGLLQLLGERTSNHYLFACTGSFLNPGPYGGFLAVCIAVLGAYAVTTNRGMDKTRQKRFGLENISYQITSIASLGALILLPATQSRAAILALCCSALLFAVRTERWRKLLKRYFLPITAVVVVAVVAAYSFKKPSADGRMFMNRISWKAMTTHGLSGAGMGNFGGAYATAQAEHFYAQTATEEDLFDISLLDEHQRLTAGCPGNAFNEYLHMGVECGPLAMLSLIAVIISAVLCSMRNGTVWCYGIMVYAVFALFSYPFHIKQLCIMLPVLLALCATPKNGGIRDISLTQYILLTLIGCLFISEYPTIKERREAEKEWEKTKQWHTMEYFEYVVEDAEQLLPQMKHSYEFLFAYGQSLNKVGQYEKSDSILKIGTELSSDPMFWNVMGNNSLAQGRYREAEERYKHAFYMVPNRLYPLYLLAKLYYTEGDTVRFLLVAEMVEEFIPKVESVNTESLRTEIRELKSTLIMTNKCNQ